MKISPSVIGRATRLIIVLVALTLVIWIADFNLMLRSVRTIILTPISPSAPFVHWATNTQPQSTAEVLRFNGSSAQLVIDPPRSLTEIQVKANVSAPAPQNFGIMAAGARRDRLPSVLFWDTRLEQLTLLPTDVSPYRIWFKERLTDAAAKDIIYAPPTGTVSVYLLPAFEKDATSTEESLSTASYIIAPRPAFDAAPKGDTAIQATFATKDVIRTYSSYVFTLRWPESTKTLAFQRITVTLKAKPITVNGLWSSIRRALRL